MLLRRLVSCRFSRERGKLISDPYGKKWLLDRKLLELRGLMYQLICISGGLQPYERGLSSWVCEEDMEGIKGRTRVEVILASCRTRDSPKKRNLTNPIRDPILQPAPL